MNENVFHYLLDYYIQIRFSDIGPHVNHGLSSQMAGRNGIWAWKTVRLSKMIGQIFRILTPLPDLRKLRGYPQLHLPSGRTEERARNPREGVRHDDRLLPVDERCLVLILLEKDRSFREGPPSCSLWPSSTDYSIKTKASRYPFQKKDTSPWDFKRPLSDPVHATTTGACVSRSCPAPRRKIERSSIFTREVSERPGLGLCFESLPMVGLLTVVVSALLRSSSSSSIR